MNLHFREGEAPAEPPPAHRFTICVPNPPALNDEGYRSATPATGEAALWHYREGEAPAEPHPAHRFTICTPHPPALSENDCSATPAIEEAAP